MKHSGSLWSCNGVLCGLKGPTTAGSSVTWSMKTKYTQWINISWPIRWVVWRNSSQRDCWYPLQEGWHWGSEPWYCCKLEIQRYKKARHKKEGEQHGRGSAGSLFSDHKCKIESGCKGCCTVFYPSRCPAGWWGARFGVPSPPSSQELAPSGTSPVSDYFYPVLFRAEFSHRLQHLDSNPQLLTSRESQSPPPALIHLHRFE